MAHYFYTTRRTSCRATQKHKSKKEYKQKRRPHGIICCNKPCGGNNRQNRKKGMPKSAFCCSKNHRVFNGGYGYIGPKINNNRSYNCKSQNEFEIEFKLFVLNYFLNPALKSKIAKYKIRAGQEHK